MKIKWLGHACFLLTSDSGTRIITDPYTTGGGLSYGQIKEAADIVTVSHDHGDHSNASAVLGKPVIIKGSLSQEAKGMKFRGIPTHHDTSQGKERGNNIIYCFTVDGFRFCHLGDLGHALSPQQIKDIGPVDVLLVPVGGFFTIDSATAAVVCEQLKPKVVFPMHYKTPKCGYPIAGVEDFIKEKTGVKRVAGSEVEIKTLPASTEFIVLQPAL